MDPSTIKLYIVLGIVVLLGVVAVLQRRHLIRGWTSLRRYLREVRVEMQKVAWPSRNEIIGETIVVLVGVAAFSIIIAVWDQALSWILRVILPG